MRIGQLAERSGTLVETIRYYENVGMMPDPPRSASGYRQYQPEHLSRLLFLRRCRDLGFSIQEIGSLLKLAEQREEPCSKVARVATHHLEAVQAKLSNLKRLERALKSLIKSCTGGPVAECRILEALSRRPD